MKTISEQYNELPLAIRELCSQVLLQDQIRDLLIEKKRTISHYRAHLKEINAHIKNCERVLRAR
jgi:hypothetical protein